MMHCADFSNLLVRCTALTLATEHSTKKRKCVKLNQQSYWCYSIS